MGLRKKWDVSGIYAGPDKDGKSFTAPFTVTLEIISGKLNTNVAQLKKRTYKQELEGEGGALSGQEDKEI